MTKYQHTHIMALNKLLTEQLFNVQDMKELNDPDKVSSTLIKHLYGLVDQCNNTETEITGMKSKNVIKLKEVSLVHEESYPPEHILAED